MKIAICFWGLTRSLKYTIKNIEQVLDRLRIFGDITTFMHTYTLDRPYVNYHGLENNILLDKDEYKLLNPDYFVFDKQEQIEIQLNLKDYHSMPDPYKTSINYQTVDNFVLAMYSLKRVTDLMLRHNKIKQFDYVVFMRPDVKWENPEQLKKKYFDRIEENMIQVPYFQRPRHAKEGCTWVNDRFAICNVDVAKVYGRRFNHMMAYSKVKPLHSETFLWDVLTKYGIKIIEINICFNRVRATGQILKDCKTKY